MVYVEAAEEWKTQPALARYLPRLTYDANADLEGPIAIANNPIGQGITKNSLKTFFEKLEKSIV